MSGLTDQQRALLINLAQEGIPLCERPFLEMAEKLGADEQSAIAAFREARESGLVRGTSAIFDARALGYSSTLAALKVPAEHLDQAAGVVSAHPGVSHNYSRDHELSLWFTLAVPPGADIESEAAFLAASAGGWPLRLFPTLRTFKIGVRFDMSGESAASHASSGQPVEPVPLSPRDIECIRALQDDLPAAPRPFEELGRRRGIPERELIDAARRFQRCGVMRRYASVVRHRSAGFHGNIMSAWDVSDAQMEQAVDVLCSSAQVSHCYERPVFPDWPYRLFAMFHARTPEMCLQAIQEAAEQIPHRKYVALRSVTEYRKERVRYFPDDN